MATEPITKIGRRYDNHIIIPIGMVCRYHLELICTATGWTYRRCCGEPTHFNGTEIGHFEETPISDGDIFQVDLFQLKICVSVTAAIRESAKLLALQGPISVAAANVNVNDISHHLRSSLTFDQRRICDLLARGMTGSDTAAEVGFDCAEMDAHLHAIASSFSQPGFCSVEGRIQLVRIWRSYI